MSNHRRLLKGAGLFLYVLRGKVKEQAVERLFAIVLAVGEVSSFGFGGLVRKAAEGISFNHLDSVLLGLKPHWLLCHRKNFGISAEPAAQPLRVTCGQSHYSARRLCFFRVAMLAPPQYKPRFALRA